jgi:hypothetical protein
MKKLLTVIIVAYFVLLSGVTLALERGAILYHTSKNDDIYGLRDELILPCSVFQIALRDIKSGHVGLYIGNQRIIHAVTPFVEETDAENFLPQEDMDQGCRYLGAKIPANYGDSVAWPEDKKDQLIFLAKQQVGVDYDIQFRHQVGPPNEGFTCVGLVEYLYTQVGYPITPAGYYPGVGGGKSYAQVYDCSSTLGFDWTGVNTFAFNVQFSRFRHPLVEVLGADIGMVHNDERYMFFPYTQYLQTTTVAVETDVPVSGGGAGSDDSDDGGPCFIATAAYGSPLHPHLGLLREVRDRYIRTSSTGRLFLSVYERYAPSLAALIDRHEILKLLTRIALLPVLGLCFLLLYTGPVTLLSFLVVLSVFLVYMTCRRKSPQNV